MSTQPYIAAPDVFLLKLPVGTQGISMQQFESAWGATDETLCFYKDVLIGLKHQPASEQYELISLLPKLSTQRAYPWPSAETFSNALFACLQTAPAWELRCEQDADQVLVSTLTDPTAIRVGIAAALAYSQGEEAACPTFIAQGKA